MPASRIRRLFHRLLPRTWVLRASLRGTERVYRPLIAKAKGEERESLIGEYLHMRDEDQEQLQAIQTQRLIRRAWKYYILAPQRTMRSDDYEDENWERGGASGSLYLKPAAVASIQRQIEDAKKRRREACAAWAQILGGLITGLVALVSVLVSLILARGK